MRISFKAAHSHLVLFWACAVHLCLHICISFFSCTFHFSLCIHVSFEAAHAHFILGCAHATRFRLRMHISSLCALTEILLWCAGRYPFGVRMQISFLVQIDRHPIPPRPPPITSFLKKETATQIGRINVCPKITPRKVRGA